MNYDELLEKYQALLSQNKSLLLENKKLKAKLGINAGQISSNVLTTNENEPAITLNKSEDAKQKVKLFMSLFKGRDDVYAKRWQNKAGRSGYSPVCLNEWKVNVCGKPKDKCSQCSAKDYAVLNEQIIEEHLRGNVTIGIYPILSDETCNFLAIDFDDIGWQEDIQTLREVCKKFEISTAVERSRSGNGAHAWFFFESQIPVTLARKFGSALLTFSMSRRHEITFKSYDRLFPNQDTLPKGGLGNLIALPLQMTARKNNNSVFIDENFNPFINQWEFLGALKKMSQERIETLITSLCHGRELGLLKESDEEERAQKPWIKTEIKLSKDDFPKDIEIVRANMLYIPKADFSQRALNALKRLAAFKNPEFYRAQAMRISTFNKPRIISCSDELQLYLCLPRGCEADIKSLLNQYKVETKWLNKTNSGRKIDVEFKGDLREEQQLAVKKLLKSKNGVLSATTAFGKTVVAANMISKKGINTLILVHRQQLLSQWKDRLEEFLQINEELPELPKKRGRKKKQSLIGQLGAGKDNLGGIIDIAVMQSLYRGGDVKECVKNYGMVIVDECHHISAFSFEQILKQVNAKYVYGLTATPTRKDGHHPIIFMHAGPIRYEVDAKREALKRPFEHFVIPRFTSLRVPIDKDEKEITIQEIYAQIVTSEIRNELIIDDVIKAWESGRNCLILTERTAHVELLTKKLSKKISNVIALTGGMGAKNTKERLAKISEMPTGKPLTIVATGKYIGEGFDEPRLDTLFLAMPISWRGTLQQYAGRLHRLYENKKEVQVYDYVDVHIRMLEKMYSKRLNGYASIGYKAKGENIEAGTVDIIYDNKSFLPVYSNDILNAQREILIVSPYVTKRRTEQMIQLFSSISDKQVKITVVTRPLEDFQVKNKQIVKQAFEQLKNAGINIIFKPNIHQKFAIIDQKIVWYGSINLLSFGNAEESIMRLESPNIANELIRSVEKRGGFY